MLKEEARSHNEEILFPDLPICDPHHHFFNIPDFQYTLDDFMKDITAGHKIVHEHAIAEEASE